MKKRITTTEKIRRLLAKGDTAKEIAKKLGVPVQYVYNVQYLERKKQGLGAIAKTPDAPKEGIGAPPKKRGRPAGVKNKPKDTGFKVPAFPNADAIVTPMQPPAEPVVWPVRVDKNDMAVALPTFPEPWWKRAARAIVRFFRGY